jgi:3-deoxy-7-phosphoheptulonate synthase
VQAAEPASNSKLAPELPTALPSSSPSSSSDDWSISSWKSKKAFQLPVYPDEEALNKTLDSIAEFPPLVFAGEARSLEEKLGEAALGRAFLLQGGDCAESFKEFNANNIRDTFRVLLQMGAVLMFGGQMPVVKVCPPPPKIDRSIDRCADFWNSSAVSSCRRMHDPLRMRRYV